MERLRFKECENCEHWKGYVTDCFENCMKPFEALEGFNTYKDLEKQGKLLKLPCAVGDTVYRFYTVNDETKIYEHRLTTLTNIVNITEAGEIGKTVFLTQKEAEAALKKLEDDAI